MSHLEAADYEVAIIGMAGRFPGAKNIEQFWNNLCQGVESIRFFSKEELISSGIDPDIINNPNYVRAHGMLEDADLFDASFFRYSPREADITDPQHRVFLECAWEALENAGYVPEEYNRRIGLFAGSAANYYLNNVRSNKNLSHSLDEDQLSIATDDDFLCTRVAYKLNLRGVSVTVQTACSTSLVAVHMACQAVLTGACDLVLAGGINIGFPQVTGYLYEEGGIYSPDGHCRAFDADSKGTLAGNGVGIVVLKRLVDALEDGDHIYAVIKGSAVNNDGSLKVGFAAPSVDGQAEAIAEAHAMAGVPAETISYVEAHGTGTSIGDPIEIAALTQAFRRSTNKRGFCAIGSVKTNIGHLSHASGVAGLIKTALALKYKLLPPSLHFERPNPQIDFENSPFYVNGALSNWYTGSLPRRAGVSSFGIGGTNAHVVLEEPIAITPSDSLRPWQLLTISAKTSSALETATNNLLAYLKEHRDLNLADVAYTLQVGRQAFDYRRTLVCRDQDDAISALETIDARRVATVSLVASNRPVIFLFPGQGTQSVSMASELYQNEAMFREEVDRCAELLIPHLGTDIRGILYPIEGQEELAQQQLSCTALTQPALFVIEYALARLWMAWGIQPQAMLGHSLGEYVAACIAGVFSLEDALAVMVTRGRLMQQLVGGAMLAVPLSERDVRQLIEGNEKLSIAAINGPKQCTLSGSAEAIDAVAELLAQQGVESRRLQTDVAYHSSMLTPILDELGAFIAALDLKPPQIPYISNVTGTWITAAEAVAPGYWVQHTREAVRFGSGLHVLFQSPEAILLECGPGQTLSRLARRHPDKLDQHVIVASLPEPSDRRLDTMAILQTLGQLWMAGCTVDWVGLYRNERRQRIPLPTYPFERQRHWLALRTHTTDASVDKTSPRRRLPVTDWLYVPCWKRSAPIEDILPETSDVSPASHCLVFLDDYGIGDVLTADLIQHRYDVTLVRCGDRFAKDDRNRYTINPRERDDYIALLRDLQANGRLPQRIIHLWNVTAPSGVRSDDQYFDDAQYLGFFSLLFLCQTFFEVERSGNLKIDVVANHTQDVIGDETLVPEKATVLGLCKVIPQEYSNIVCRSIDIGINDPGAPIDKKIIDQLAMEFVAHTDDPVVAYRGRYRWIQTFEPVAVNKPLGMPKRVREHGVYLITGGLGNIGFAFSEYLAREAAISLILTGRSPLPDRSEWEQWLATYDKSDPTSRKIQRVKRLEQLGAKVLVISADVADRGAMSKVVSQVQAQFGEIHGVIHAAGFSGFDAFCPIRDASIIACQHQFRPKIYGMMILEEILRGKPLDFCLSVSSLASVLGGLGSGPYSAAHICVDTLAHMYDRASATRWTTINLDAWHREDDNGGKDSSGAFAPDAAITPEEGRAVIQYIISSIAKEQVIVSTRDLHEQIRRWVKLEAPRASEDAPAVEEVILHPRPNLRDAYIAPRSELEQTIATVWQSLLGMERVGIHDNFFDLGGDSLLSMQILSRLRKTLGVDIPLQLLFDSPTVAGFAASLEPSLTERQGTEDAVIAKADQITREDLLAQLDQLPDDEIDRLLNEVLGGQ